MTVEEAQSAAVVPDAEIIEEMETEEVTSFA
jgi:hypothetical protein